LKTLVFQASNTSNPFDFWYISNATMKKLLSIFAILLAASSFIKAQQSSDPQLIQFTGMIITESDGRMAPVPYATISLPQKRRGTYSDYRGFFSIVVERGDKVRFSCIGLKTITITVPIP
jgi:hypothetical protein